MAGLKRVGTLRAATAGLRSPGAVAGDEGGIEFDTTEAVGGAECMGGSGDAGCTGGIDALDAAIVWHPSAKKGA